MGPGILTLKSQISPGYWSAPYFSSAVCLDSAGLLEESGLTLCRLKPEYAFLTGLSYRLWINQILESIALLKTVLCESLPLLCFLGNN